MAEGKDVTVTQSNPLQVTDGNRTFNKVTVEVGGVIRVQTLADVRIAELIIK
jgi:hypothetical protein